MADSNSTKSALADAMKKLMVCKSFAKISISDLCEECGLNRKSFYYHFKDKYDLVNWIFYTELITELQNSSNKDEYEELKNICRYLYDNRAFYINALKFTGQNSFYEYFGEVIYQLLKAAFNESFGNSDQSDFNAMFYADALRACIFRWLTSGAKMPPDEFVGKIRSALAISPENQRALLKEAARGALTNVPWN